MDKVDILIVGAGVVGLAIAAELSAGKRNMLLVEKNTGFGRETSSRNSEVIHGGMYYPSESLKAKLCVEGRQFLYEILEKNNVPYLKTAKIIIASEKHEEAVLEKLFTQGTANGVTGLELIGRQKLQFLEPNVSGLSALYSSETGILDSHRLMEYFLNQAQDNGCAVAYNSEVVAIGKTAGGYKVAVKNGPETMDLEAAILINAAGLNSDSIAAQAGLDIKKLGLELSYCKGQYFRVNGRCRGLVSRLVYPAPKPKGAGLGIHATPDLGGGLRLGPDDEYLTLKQLDYSVDNSRAGLFFESAAKFLPFLRQEDLFADTAGIRPKLQKPGGEFRDFVIQEESQKGLPGFINLIGIESPGLTASPAIARYVRSLIR